jgi:serine/threonine protein kinase
VKVIEEEKEDENEKIINLLIKFENPFIIRYYDSFIDKSWKKRIVVMEFFEGADLRNFITLSKKYRQTVSEEVFFWSLFLFFEECKKTIYPVSDGSFFLT